MTYLHACCFSPTQQTFIQAIKRNFLTTWPGLSAELVKKYLPTSTFTAKGHLNQEKSGLQSTKHKGFEIVECEDLYPPSNIPNIKTNDLIFAMVDTTDKAYFDLPGRFPFCSSRGNQYLVIAYHYDANAILGVAIKNRQASTITNAWTELNKKFEDAGVNPNKWILDNEASQELKAAITKQQAQYQLVPPYTHRANALE